jgi:hypothetical protein
MRVVVSATAESQGAQIGQFWAGCVPEELYCRQVLVLWLQCSNSEAGHNCHPEGGRLEELLPAEFSFVGTI